MPDDFEETRRRMLTDLVNFADHVPEFESWGPDDPHQRIADILEQLGRFQQLTHAPLVTGSAPCEGFSRPLTTVSVRRSLEPLDLESLTTEEATMERQQPIRLSIIDQYCDAELNTFPVSHRCGLKRGHAGDHFSGAASWRRVVSDPTWWMSFADPNRPTGQQFLGVVLVDAPSFEAAYMAINAAGINPGGEVQGHSADGAPSDELERLAKAPKLTLLSFQQLTDLGFKLGRPSDVDL